MESQEATRQLRAYTSFLPPDSETPPSQATRCFATRIARGRPRVDVDGSRGGGGSVAWVRDMLGIHRDNDLVPH